MRSFIERYPWTVAFLILFVAMCLGFLRVQNVQDNINSDRNDRTQENIKKDKQFCTAIPNAAEAAAQALINILVADLRKDGGTVSEINALIDRGHRYTDEARRIALSDLPACQKLLGG